MFALFTLIFMLIIKVSFALIKGAWWIIKNGCQLIALICVGAVALAIKAKVAIDDAIRQRKLNKAYEAKIVREAKKVY